MHSPHNPLGDLRFKFPWRSYQQRVLDELTDHLDDAQLHVVAAPGSGKPLSFKLETGLLKGKRKDGPEWSELVVVFSLLAFWQSVPDWLLRAIPLPSLPNLILRGLAR